MTDFYLNERIMEHRVAEEHRQADLPLEQEGPGRPLELDMRQAVNAIFYVVRTDYQWENLPKEYPNHNSVYYHYRH